MVASAIHCGLLPVDRVPDFKDFLNLPYYDRTLPELIGKPYRMGSDEHRNDVYFMGMWSERPNMEKTLRMILELAEIPTRDFLMQDTFPLIRFSTKLGGLLSKRYSLTKLGRRLTIWGIQRQYPGFVSLVESVKEKLYE